MAMQRAVVEVVVAAAAAADPSDADAADPAVGGGRDWGAGLTVEAMVLRFG